MINKDYDEYLIISGKSMLSEREVDSFPALLLKRNRGLINVSKKIVRKNGLKLTLIGIRENHPSRHRLLPLDYFKKQTEMVLVPYNTSTKRMEIITRDFTASELRYSSMKVNVSGYLDEAAIFIEKKPWYLSLTNQLKKVFWDYL